MLSKTAKHQSTRRRELNTTTSRPLAKLVRDIGAEIHLRGRLEGDKKACVACKVAHRMAKGVANPVKARTTSINEDCPDSYLPSRMSAVRINPAIFARALPLRILLLPQCPVI